MYILNIFVYKSRRGSGSHTDCCVDVAYVYAMSAAANGVRYPIHPDDFAVTLTVTC
jgi:hypothetical protein